jgi:hypothetical protein
MITVSGYLHRDSLRDLIQRWMCGASLRTDGNELMQLVNLNNAYVSRYLAAFSEEIFQRFHPSAIGAALHRPTGLKHRVSHGVPVDHWTLNFKPITFTGGLESLNNGLIFIHMRNFNLLNR